MKVTDFSGNKCAKRYEKEYFDRYADFLTFYIDDKLRFERFCHGEAAGSVFYASGTLDNDGNVIYEKPFSRDVDESVLPKKLTKVQGNNLYFDDCNRKWEFCEELLQDKKNGYSKISLFFKKKAK